MARGQDRSARVYEPDAIPPGDYLLERLDQIGMTQKELSDRAGLSARLINQIVKGDAPLSQSTALKLERVTGVEAHHWNLLEARYQERLARAARRKELASEQAWADDFPISELRQLGIVTKTRHDRVAVIEEFLSWFGVASRDAWERVWDAPAAAFRKTAAHESNKVAIATWLRLGERAASQIECAPYDEDTFRDVLDDARTMTRDDPSTWYGRLRPALADAGVAFVIIREVKGCRTYGVTRWPNPYKALIQLSLRRRTEGQFWFSFFHEACHVLRHPKKATFVQDGDHEDPFEREADQFARRFLIPRRYERTLDNLQTIEDALDFAHEVGVSDAIVLERLRREREHDFPYNRGPQPRKVPFPSV